MRGMLNVEIRNPCKTSPNLSPRVHFSRVSPAQWQFLLPVICTRHGNVLRWWLSITLRQDACKVYIYGGVCTCSSANLWILEVSRLDYTQTPRRKSFVSAFFPTLPIYLTSPASRSRPRLKQKMRATNPTQREVESDQDGVMSYGTSHTLPRAVRLSSWILPGPFRCVAQNPRIPVTWIQRIYTSNSLC